MVRDLVGVVKREGADLGVFVCLRATKEMKLEASRSDLVELPGGLRHQVQVVEVDDLINGPNLGILTQLNTLQAAQAAKAARKPRTTKAEKLAAQRPLPPMSIQGGKRAAQAPLDMGEPVLVARPPGAKRRRS
jgi:site-specific DNA-methyltransferase (adenine-specific)